jgi:hypothetical protein
MQAQAAEFSGLRRKIPLLFSKQKFETVCFDLSLFSTRLLKQALRVCLRAF